MWICLFCLKVVTLRNELNLGKNVGAKISRKYRSVKMNLYIPKMNLLKTHLEMTLRSNLKLKVMMSVKVLKDFEEEMKVEKAPQVWSCNL